MKQLVSGIDPNQKISYLGNSKIKRDGVQEEWTMERIAEYKRCSEDPVYFIKKYIKVVHLDHGLVPFDLYEYQERMIAHFNENRFSIVLSCRQSGKCVYKYSKIKIRNKKSGEIIETTIGELYENIKTEKPKLSKTDNV